MGSCERKTTLIETNMTRGDDAARGKVVAAVATVVRRVAEKHALDGAMIKLMARGGGGVRKTATAEHAEKSVIRCDIEEELMWGAWQTGVARFAVHEERGDTQGLGPEAS